MGRDMRPTRGRRRDRKGGRHSTSKRPKKLPRQRLPAQEPSGAPHVDQIAGTDVRPPNPSQPPSKTRASTMSDGMAIAHLPKSIRETWEIIEWRYATAILENDFPAEWQEIIEVLSEFKLLKSEVAAKGGSKSKVSSRIDGAFYKRGWKEKSFDTKVVIDSSELESPTHGVDCFKNRVALEVEWNNKDPFYDRDLNNFRLLFELRAISVGVIVTRSDELQEIFNALGKGSSYGDSTTHMSKLLRRINGGGGGGCPILVFGIKKSLYVKDE